MNFFSTSLSKAIRQKKEDGILSRNAFLEVPVPSAFISANVNMIPEVWFEIHVPR